MWGAANIKKVGEGQRTPSCAGHGKVATDRCSKPQAKEVGLMERLSGHMSQKPNANGESQVM